MTRLVRDISVQTISLEVGVDYSEWCKDKTKGELEEYVTAGEALTLQMCLLLGGEYVRRYLHEDCAEITIGYLQELIFTAMYDMLVVRPMKCMETSYNYFDSCQLTAYNPFFKNMNCRVFLKFKNGMVEEDTCGWHVYTWLYNVLDFEDEVNDSMWRMGNLHMCYRVDNLIYDERRRINRKIVTPEYVQMLVNERVLTVGEAVTFLEFISGI